MFIVSLHYKVPLARINEHLEDHVAFLERHFRSGEFLASGPKVPRTGGVILATVAEREKLEAIVEADPFYKADLADYQIEEFQPTRFRSGLESIAKIALIGA
jgi:uncharacterized protein YciI